MTPSQATEQNDERNFDWVHLEDFSPGCFDNSYISIADPKLTAPLGSADASATFCCASIASGGLGPLPALAQIFTYTTSLPGTLDTWWVLGFITNPGLDSNAPEVIFFLEGDDGTTHYVLVESTLPKTGASNVILTSNSTTTPGFFGAPYLTWTRMTDDGTGNPTPVLVFPSAVVTDANTTFGHVYIYPDLSTPTVFSVQDMVTPGSTGGAGQVIAYGERIIVLNGVDYDWPIGGGINTNENIDFTDPPLSAQYPDQKTVLGAEEPWGYGAWGTISVGELMLLKKHGGGLIVYGDIDAPSSVISMPGVQSVGGFVGSAAATAIGLVYCSEDRGAWIWNGGNTSQKISAQLRDNFYDATTPTNLGSNNYGFFIGRWQDWVLFSNNYLYNPDTGGWWVLYPTGPNGTGTVPGKTLFWYSEGALGNEMYAAPLRFGTAAGLNREWYYRFDNTVPAPHYQWKSLPIHVTKDADRVLDVRQVVLRVSDPSASGTATATVTIGGFSATTTTTIGPTPTTFRFNVGSGARGLEDITLQINGDNPTGGKSSPIVHSCDVGYQVRAGVAVDN